jgi:hypothetical protein
METKGVDLKPIPQKALSVLLSPSGFFREMPRTGGYVEPLIFMVALGVVAGLIQSVFAMFGLHEGAGLAMGLASIILLPIFIAISGFIGAAVLFVIWKLMGSQESYETAYRCGAYISALTPITIILGLIPYLGGVAGIALATFYFVIATVEVHRIPSKKAWLVFGIIGAVLAIINVSAQYAVRQSAREAAKFQTEMEKASKAMQKQLEQMKRQ